MKINGAHHYNVMKTELHPSALRLSFHDIKTLKMSHSAMQSALIEISEPNEWFTLEEDIIIATSTYQSSSFQLVAQEEHSLKCLHPSFQPWGRNAICGCLICKQGLRRFVKLIGECLI